MLFHHVFLRSARPRLRNVILLTDAIYFHNASKSVLQVERAAAVNTLR